MEGFLQSLKPESLQAESRATLWKERCAARDMDMGRGSGLVFGEFDRDVHRGGYGKEDHQRAYQQGEIAHADHNVAADIYNRHKQAVESCQTRRPDGGSQIERDQSHGHYRGNQIAEVEADQLGH